VNSKEIVSYIIWIYRNDISREITLVYQAVWGWVEMDRLWNLKPASREWNWIHPMKNLCC